MNVISSIRAKVLLAALVAVVTGSAFGYWGAAEYEQRERRDDIVWLVQDTSLRLRMALVSEPVAATADDGDALRPFYEHAVAVDRHLQKLRNIDTSDGAALGALADAADDYLLTSREILLRRASSQRYRVKFSDDLRQLRHHMRADNRTGAWITAAVRAKERVDEDYRDFRIASTALVTLIDSFPAAQAKIAPHVDAARRINDAVVATARERMVAASQATARELERYANLNRYR
jgi:hypothetical protein